MHCTYFVRTFVNMKNARLEVRLNSDLKEKLNELAKDNKRKANDYLNLLIEYAISKKLKL